MRARERLASPLVLLVILGLGASSASPAAATSPQAPPLRISICFEIQEGRELFLAAEGDDRRAPFAELANHWQHAIPVDFSELDEVPTVAARTAVFAPVMKRPDCLEFLRAVVRDPVGKSADEVALAVALLGDHAQSEDLSALLDGFQKIGPASNLLPELGRNIGRAVAGVHRGGADDTLAGGALQSLRALLKTASTFELAAAIEGLYLAGETEDAVAPLERILFKEGGGDLPGDLKLLDACKHLLNHAGLDPAIVKRANELARQAIEDVLAGKAGGGDAPIAGLSRAGQLLNPAVNVMRVTARVADWDLLSSCYQNPLAGDVLSMDGLQHLRLTLQRLRSQAPAEARAALDRFVFTQLYGVAEQVFQLEESPMDDAEHRRFLSGRNARYNAAAYFMSQWKKHPDVREPWVKADEAAEYLGALAQADADVTSDESSQPVFRKVKEKLETRVLCARLLAKLEAKSGGTPELDLKQFFLRTMADEIGAELEPVVKAMEALDRSGSPCLRVLMRKTKDPADMYVRDCASLGLQDLGYMVSIGSQGLEIRPRGAGDQTED